MVTEIRQRHKILIESREKPGNIYSLGTGIVLPAEKFMKMYDGVMTN